MNGQVLKKKKKKNLPLPEPSKTILPQRASGFSNLRKKEWKMIICVAFQTIQTNAEKKKKNSTQAERNWMISWFLSKFNFYVLQIKHFFF